MSPPPAPSDGALTLSMDSFLGSLASNEAVISISVNDVGRVTAYETEFFWVPIYSCGELVENRRDNDGAERACILRERRAKR